jgi:YD repeat-containing protein
VMAIAGTGRASETVTYKFDALGRLVGVTTSGGPNNALAVSASYDPAGNRCSYYVAGAGGAETPAPPACPSGTPAPPPPPPPSGNQSPVAVNDGGSMGWCAGASFNVLANDSDPDGNVPLALVSVSGGGTKGTPSISGTQVWFEPSGVTGTATVTYTMRDSLGATASATLTITIVDGSCGPSGLQQQEETAPASSSEEAPPAEAPPEEGPG